MNKSISQKILANASRLFARKGFFKTTVDDIARSAKVAKGTVYLYFKDKSDIYIRIIERQLRTALDDLQAINKEKLDSSQKLRGIANEWLEHSVEFHRFFPIISMENINQALKIMKEIRLNIFPIISQIISVVTAIIEDGIKRGEFRRVNPRVAAISFLNIMRAPLLLNIFTSEKVTSCDEIFELFFDGLKKKELI